MAWVKPTIRDLTTALSAAEVDAYSRSADYADAVSAVLEQTVQAARGFICAGGLSLPSETGSVPASLITFVTDYAVFKLLKRMDVPVSEDRRTAYRDALAVFQKIAAGQMRVEAWEDASAPAAVALPCFEKPRPARRLD